MCGRAAARSYLRIRWIQEAPGTLRTDVIGGRLSSRTVVSSANCPRCGSDGLVLMKRLDTGAVFAECANCRFGYARPDLTDAFSTADLYWERSPASMQEARAAGWEGLVVQGTMPEQSATPDPFVVAAWFVLDRVALERVPWWAAEWLTQGYDGETLRYLAGEDGNDIHKIKDLLPGALAEMNVIAPLSATDAAAVALDDVARKCRDGSITERDATELVTHIMAAADYPVELYELPLGSLFGLEDEWDAGWGRGHEVLQREVQRACAAQLDHREN